MTFYRVRTGTGSKMSRIRNTALKTWCTVVMLQKWTSPKKRVGSGSVITGTDPLIGSGTPDLTRIENYFIPHRQHRVYALSYLRYLHTSVADPRHFGLYPDSDPEPRIQILLVLLLTFTLLRIHDILEWIRIRGSMPSVADPGCLFRILIKEFKYFNPKKAKKWFFKL